MIPRQSKSATKNRIFFSNDVSLSPLLLTEKAVIAKITIDTKPKIPRTIAKFPTEFKHYSKIFIKLTRLKPNLETLRIIFYYTLLLWNF